MGDGADRRAVGYNERMTPTSSQEAATMITLEPARAQRRATYRDTKGPDGLFAHLQPFVTRGGLLAYRYNDPSNNVPPPANFPGSWYDGTIPVDAVYVVRYYNTPLAWVQRDGTVTVVEDSYGRSRTAAILTPLRAWLGCAVLGTTTSDHHIVQGYRKATPHEWEAARVRESKRSPSAAMRQTTCVACSLDVEGSDVEGWMDRGGNGSCPSSGEVHVGA